MKTSKSFKFISSELKSREGDCTWEIGVWKKHVGEIKLCSSGFHSSPTALKSLDYVYGDRWFIVEQRGKRILGEDKAVYSEMRLVNELPISILQEFGIACAWHALKFYEDKYPNDFRVRDAIKAAEKCLKDPSEENKSAARSAAWSAGSAARSAWSAGSAGSAETKWQEKTLNKIIRKYLKEKNNKP